MKFLNIIAIASTVLTFLLFVATEKNGIVGFYNQFMGVSASIAIISIVAIIILDMNKRRVLSANM